MKTLLIVWHSATGGTRAMAEAAALGAAGEPEVAVRLLQAGDAGADDVLAADGYIFATPENLASMAGRMKDFFDRTYYPVLDRVNGRSYAALICAGSDGTGAARQLARIVTGWRLRAIAEPVIVRVDARTPEAILAPKQIDAVAVGACCRASARRWRPASRQGFSRALTGKPMNAATPSWPGLPGP